MRHSTRFVLYVLDEFVLGVVVAFVLFSFQVDIWVFLVFLGVFLSVFVFLVYVFAPQLRQPITGSEGLVGRQGVVVDRLDLSGRVQVRGELWDAESSEGVLDVGAQVVVVRVKGLHLVVKKH